MANSLAHTKWICKYHIVFTPKYRRKIIYHQLRKDIQQIIKDLCKWKGVEIIEGHMMPDHVHLLVSIPPNSIRPLAKLSKAVKVADTGNQGKAESKALSAVTVTLREDTESFKKTDGVFNKDTFS